MGDQAQQGSEVDQAENQLGARRVRTREEEQAVSIDMQGPLTPKV